MTWLWIFPLVLLLAAAWRWQFWRLPKKGLLALMYHHIGHTNTADEQYPFTISPRRFEEQLDMLQKHGFSPVGLDELKAAASSGRRLPEKPVLLTFDDGYADNFQNLFPILQKRGVKVLIFLITDFIGKEPGYMSWEQVLQMQQSGLVQFGSHTASHARLRRLPEEEILRELTQSKKTLEEKLGVACEAFCYPFGSGGFDKRVRPLVFRAGYLFDFSTKPGINPWPWKGKKTILRAFPRGGETLTDFYVQITRGKSKF